MFFLTPNQQCHRGEEHAVHVTCSKNKALAGSSSLEQQEDSVDFSQTKYMMVYTGPIFAIFAELVDLG